MAAAAQVGGERGREGGKRKRCLTEIIIFRHVLQLLRHILSSPVTVSL